MGKEATMTIDAADRIRSGFRQPFQADIFRQKYIGLRNAEFPQAFERADHRLRSELPSAFRLHGGE